MSGCSDIALGLVLLLHLAWILWVILGALWTRGRPWLTGFHIASLLWGIAVEIAPWPCPLTMLAQFLQGRAGLGPYSGGFLLHYLGMVVYPDISANLLVAGGIAVCVINLLIYCRRFLPAA